MVVGNIGGGRRSSSNGGGGGGLDSLNYGCRIFSPRASFVRKFIKRGGGDSGEEKERHVALQGKFCSGFGPGASSHHAGIEPVRLKHRSRVSFVPKYRDDMKKKENNQRKWHNQRNTSDNKTDHTSATRSSTSRAGSASYSCRSALSRADVRIKQT